MAAIGVLITIVIATAALVTVGMVVAVIAGTVMTAVAVHREERLRTLKWWAPGRLAQLVRAILGVYVRRMDSDFDEGDRPEERPPWYERTGGPTRR
jgi:hypothetical protein